MLKSEVLRQKDTGCAQATAVGLRGQHKGAAGEALLNIDAYIVDTSTAPEQHQTYVHSLTIPNLRAHPSISCFCWRVSTGRQRALSNSSLLATQSVLPRRQQTHTSLLHQKLECEPYTSFAIMSTLCTTGPSFNFVLTRS